MIEVNAEGINSEDKHKAYEAVALLLYEVAKKHGDESADIGVITITGDVNGYPVQPYAFTHIHGDIYRYFKMGDKDNVQMPDV